VIEIMTEKKPVPNAELEALRVKCKACASTKRITEESEECTLRKCEIRRAFDEAHRRILCAPCTVFGCSNNPDGGGKRGAPLFFDIPEECIMLDCDPSI
jgi:hypothetical protein